MDYDEIFNRKPAKTTCLKRPSGFSMVIDQDEKGNVIHYKDSSNNEYWKEYNEAGQLVYYTDSDWDEMLNEYDNRGRLLHHVELNSGYEEWYKYDDDKQIVSYKDNYGSDTTWTYTDIDKGRVKSLL